MKYFPLRLFAFTPSFCGAGPIPEALMALTNLVGLNLGGNQLTGKSVTFVVCFVYPAQASRACRGLLVTRLLWNPAEQLPTSRGTQIGMVVPASCR